MVRSECDLVTQFYVLVRPVSVQYVLILSELPVPSVLLVYLSLIPPGISGTAITGYSSTGKLIIGIYPINLSGGCFRFNSYKFIGKYRS